MMYFVTDKHNHPVMRGKKEDTVQQGFFSFQHKEDAKKYRNDLNESKCSISGVVKPFKVSQLEFYR